MGTGLGIFWIDFMCKPIFKGLMKEPTLALLCLFALYSFIAYTCLKSAYLSDRS